RSRAIWQETVETTYEPHPVQAVRAPVGTPRSNCVMAERKFNTTNLHGRGLSGVVTVEISIRH
ncbi:MAG: hypothetical protein ACO27A_04330, partial [Limnohabitans sp.]